MTKAAIITGLNSVVIEFEKGVLQELTKPEKSDLIIKLETYLNSIKK